MSCGPPCPPCAPGPPEPCPQYCEPPPPPPCARPKPVMRGLLHAHIKSVLTQGCILSILGGAAWWVFVCRPRMEAYRHFHDTAEIDDWAEEMARKGCFQSVPVNKSSE